MNTHLDFNSLQITKTTMSETHANGRSIYIRCGEKERKKAREREREEKRNQISFRTITRTPVERKRRIGEQPFEQQAIADTSKLYIYTYY